MSNYITLKFAYHNTDFTRTYKLEDVQTAALPNVKQKIKDINTALATEGYGLTKVALSANFVANEYDATDTFGTGHLQAIAEATIVQESIDKIPLFE